MKKTILLCSLLLPLLLYFWGNRPSRHALKRDNATEEQSAGIKSANAPVAIALPQTKIESSEAARQEMPPAAALTPEQFQHLLQDTEGAVPSQASLRKLPAEAVHFTPVSVQEAGAKLGEVAEALEQNPALAPEAFAFYEKCASNESFPNSVRALCFADYEQLGKSLGLVVKESIAPDHVRELAQGVEGL